MGRTLVVALIASALAWGDAGVLLPADKPQPEPAILSLAELSIDVHVDNGHARVSIREIFASHHATVLEGNYLFSLPGDALISDFAVWDDVTRIPGVILERRSAGEIYAKARYQIIDPGLLQAGLHDADEDIQIESEHRADNVDRTPDPGEVIGVKREDCDGQHH